MDEGLQSGQGMDGDRWKEGVKKEDCEKKGRNGIWE